MKKELTSALDFINELSGDVKVHYNRDRIAKLMKDYARIQIEKDRERVKDVFDLTTDDDKIDSVPITLD